MRRASGLLIVALAGALSLAAGRLTPYPARLPDGPGRAIAERACLVCHSAQLIAQQHKDQAAWEKTIAQMEKWGAPLNAAQHDSLRAYLVKTSGAAPGRPAPHG
jgi:cytochrome c5